MRLRDRLRGKLIADVLAHANLPAGTDEAKVAAAVDQVASERPIIDWLLAGGWEQIVALVLKILVLLG